MSNPTALEAITEALDAMRDLILNVETIVLDHPSATTIERLRVAKLAHTRATVSMVFP